MEFASARAVCDICFSLYEDSLMLKAVELEDGAILTGDFGLVAKHLQSNRKEVKWLAKVSPIQKIRQLFKGGWCHRRFFVVLLGFLLAEVANEPITLEFLTSQLNSSLEAIEAILQDAEISLPHLAVDSLQEMIIPGFGDIHGEIANNLLNPACSYAALKG